MRAVDLSPITTSRAAVFDRSGCVDLQHSKNDRRRRVDAADQVVCRCIGVICDCRCRAYASARNADSTHNAAVDKVCDREDVFGSTEF